LRAGLLSEPRVSRFIEDHFVSTWVLIDDLKQNTGKGDRFADTLFDHWEYPLDLMFLSSDGEFVSKLNSFRDLPNPHPDVGGHGNPFLRRGLPHSAVFLSHARQFLELPVLELNPTEPPDPD
jgi:hypothetical protein